jgi:hypothetical protein
MEMLGTAISAGDPTPDPREPGRMTAAQIAKAIDDHPEQTETALRCMEEAGQVLRNEGRRWAMAATRVNGHALNGSNETFQMPAAP